MYSIIYNTEYKNECCVLSVIFITVYIQRKRSVIALYAAAASIRECLMRTVEPICAVDGVGL